MSAKTNKTIHKSTTALIVSTMGVYFVKFWWEDIWHQLRCNKRQVLLCVLFAALGFALGIVLFTLGSSWWCQNRCNFAECLIEGNIFSVLLCILLPTLLLSALLCLFSMWRCTRFCFYLLLAATGLYFGAHCCAACTCYGALGLLYVLFPLLFGQLADMLCIFVALTQCPCRKTFRQAFCDCKTCLALQLFSALGKMFLIFVFLRLITALI